MLCLNAMRILRRVTHLINNKAPEKTRNCFFKFNYFSLFLKRFSF